MDSSDFFDFVFECVQVADLAGVSLEIPEPRDGQEATADEQRQRSEISFSRPPLTAEVRATIARRGAALHREFWETQS